MTTQSNLGLVGNYNINGTISTPIYVSSVAPSAPSHYGQFPIGSQWFNKITQTLYVFYGGTTWKQISNAGGSSGPITWVSVSSSQGTSSNMGYLVTSGSAAITLTLPLTSAVGDVLFFQGVTTAEGAAPAFPGYRIGQNADQQILISNTVATTLGTAGSLATSQQGAAIQLVCVQANTLWNVVDINNVSFVPS
jgi:hypothetical protein